ncbi:MAG TPA: hypothetical protein VJA19_03780 [Pseudomonas sp.]|nr:hypothetical protein [Pseudomonas sp.]
MTMVRLALYKARGGLSNAAIRIWTGSEYSHCELVVEGWSYSASVMDKGVRRKRIGKGDGEISLAAAKWDLVDLPWVSAEEVLAYFKATDHHRYGWPSLLASQLFNRARSYEGLQFCSEWCAAATGLSAPASYSPGRLASICGDIELCVARYREVRAGSRTSSQY